MTFIEKIGKRWETRNTMVCIGLDPDPGKTPACLKDSKKPLFDFNRAIIDATHDLVCAYKPQFAYYAACAAEDQLAKTIDYIRTTYPEVPVILDSKRGDIDSTAAMYAKEAFERYRADAVTVNPYMGSDALKPFLAWKDKGVVILCRTSNPSSVEIQRLTQDGKTVYQRVAELAQSTWNGNGNVLLVVGATCPDELAEIRKICPDLPFLVPGVGAQGGDVEKVVCNGLNHAGGGLIINSSRGILYAGSDEAFAATARKAALLLRDTIRTAKDTVISARSCRRP
jgi:orotidine-5'-phosphate decarboxylase